MLTRVRRDSRRQVAELGNMTRRVELSKVHLTRSGRAGRPGMPPWTMLAVRKSRRADQAAVGERWLELVGPAGLMGVRMRAARDREEG